MPGIVPPPTALAELKRVLEALTVPELRELALVVDETGETLPHVKGQLVTHLLSQPDQGRVAKTAHRLEALSAFKHVFLFRIEGQLQPLPESRTKLAEWTAALWPECQQDIPSPDPDSDAVQPISLVPDVERAVAYVKFVHWVESTNWVQVDENTRKKENERVRHVIVAVLDARNLVLELRLSGFRQSPYTPAEKKRSYLGVATTTYGMIADRLHLQVSGLAIRHAIERVLTHMATEVVDVRRDVTIPGVGNVAVEAAEAAMATNSAGVLASLLAKNPAAVGFAIADVQEALRSGTVDAMVLLWTRHHVLSRVNFHEVGPELFFVWKGERKSLDVVESIVGTLIRAASQVESPEATTIAKWIENLDLGTQVTLAQVIQKGNMPAERALRVLEQARALGQLSRCYRIRTDSGRAIQGYLNAWQASLSMLPAEVHLDNDEVVNARDPKNIEVAFVRT